MKRYKPEKYVVALVLASMAVLAILGTVLWLATRDRPLAQGFDLTISQPWYLVVCFFVGFVVAFIPKNLTNKIQRDLIMLYVVLFAAAMVLAFYQNNIFSAMIVWNNIFSVFVLLLGNLLTVCVRMRWGTDKQAEEEKAALAAAQAAEEQRAREERFGTMRPTGAGGTIRDTREVEEERAKRAASEAMAAKVAAAMAAVEEQKAGKALHKAAKAELEAQSATERAARALEAVRAAEEALQARQDALSGRAEDGGTLKETGQAARPRPNGRDDAENDGD